MTVTYNLKGNKVVADQFVPSNVINIAALTDSSTGTSGGDTIGAVTDTASAANAIATLAAKVNALLAALK